MPVYFSDILGPLISKDVEDPLEKKKLVKEKALQSKFEEQLEVMPFGACTFMIQGQGLWREEAMWLIGRKRRLTAPFS